MDWTPRTTYSSSKDDLLNFERTLDHPLQLKDDNLKKASQTNEIIIKVHSTETVSKKQDQLQQNDWIDPLSAALNDVKQQESCTSFTTTKTKRTFLDDDFENFEQVMNSITNKSIALLKSIRIRSLLTEYPTNSTLSSANLNFIQNLNNLKSDLNEAWQNNSRVKALRTVCLVSKHLGDIERFDLYAYKFATSVQILDEFNELIYNRIEEKIKESDDIEMAKETCRNWHFKICSIQELISRLYLEISTLNTFSTFFIYETTDQLVKTIKRLIETVHGVGDPFISVFIYVYLSKTILNIFPERKELFFQIYSDFLVRIEQIKQIELNLPEFLIKFVLAKPNETCTYLNYTQFYTSPLDWILKCLSYKSTYEQSETVYKELNVKLSNHQSSDLFFILFNQLLPKLNSSFVIENHKYVIELIKTILVQNTNTNLPKYQLISNLSTLFLSDDASTSKISREEKLNLFREIWKLIKTLNEKEYSICTNAWIDFAVRYFSMSQINSILSNIIKHVIARREFVNCNEDLVQILVKILNSSNVDYQQFLTSDTFVPFIEMFQRETTKVLACKTVLEYLIKAVRKGDDHLNYSDSDYMTILIYISKTMHDSVDQLSSEEERRDLSN